jgi:hypothetical protein
MPHDPLYWFETIVQAQGSVDQHLRQIAQQYSPGSLSQGMNQWLQQVWLF